MRVACLMPEFEVSFARSARKDLESLPVEVADRILYRIERLTENPRPRGSVKLQGRRGLWRIRVGDYRVVYTVDEAACYVDITQIRHRRDVYRDF